MMKRILLVGIFIAGSLGSAQRVKTVNEDVHSGQIIYASASRGTSAERPWRFVLLDFATGSQRLLPDYGTTGFGVGNRPVAPAWSPDGRQVLYSLNEDSEGVFLYDFETGRHERLDQPDGTW